MTDVLFPAYFAQLCADLGGHYTETTGTYELREGEFFDSLTYACDRTT